jgi:hypothetical protein
MSTDEMFYLVDDAKKEGNSTSLQRLGEKSVVAASTLCDLVSHGTRHDDGGDESRTYMAVELYR